MRINLFGTIVSNDDAWFYEWFGAEHTTPKMIIDQLTTAGDTDVELYINSPGGDVWAGSEIYTALKEHGRVTAKVVGVAASAASVALCGAVRALIAPTAQVMIHRSSTVTAGNKQAHDEGSQQLNSVDEGMVNAYEDKTGMSREEIIALMDATTFLDANRAVELGFADEKMFAQTDKVAASATATLPVMPTEFLNTFKAKLIEANLAPGGPAAKPPEPEPVASATPNTQTPKEGTPKMDINQLRSEHPELVAEIMTASIATERERISALNKLEGAPGAAPFIKAAIESGETAQDVAMKIVEASAKRQTQEGADRQSDADQSGVNAVANQPGINADDKAKQDKEARINAMIEKAKQLKGGRK